MEEVREVAAQEPVYREARAVASVSREKWAQHALGKMQRGYALIVPEGRRSASFFKVGKGYEACAYHTARQLIREGLVVAAGPHALGTLYLPTPEALQALR